MSLHRHLLLGTGFYDVLRSKPTAPEGDVVSAVANLQLSDLDSVVRSLPTTRLLDVTNRKFVDALMEEALPEDRTRFAEYLSNRPLGLGIITAPPGFGKTTALAVGALAMVHTLRKVYLSGPTHVSVDNAASRVDVVDARVTKRLNDKFSPKGGSPAYRRKLIVRAYKINDELGAFYNLLRNPHDGDQATPGSTWFSQSKWKLNLSLAYWLLVILRSPAVRQLGPDDKPVLHDIRSNCDNNEAFARLREVATGRIDWAAYEKGGMVPEASIKGEMQKIFYEADVIATTPAQACNQPFRGWRETTAQGIVVDEAANMNRPDLLCVWGNTCLPCLLAGDEKQPAPAVMTMNETDDEGDFLNRFGADGKISPIHHFKSMGWPIYRLRVQLRMAVGQFDLTHNEAYKDIPFTYGPGSIITLPRHEIGRKLETFLKTRFPDLQPAPTGSLRPVFVNCDGSRSFKDPLTGSKRNPDQSRIALELLVDFVKTSGAKTEDIVILTPYKANVETIDQLRKFPEFATLASLRPCLTVDSFQGQECDIVVIIMGTTVAVGPGFTTDEQRLNVLLSRHKCGLIIVGDINVTGRFAKVKGQIKAPPLKRIRVIGEGGDVHFVKCNMLRNIHKNLVKAGRVVHIQVPREMKDAKDAKDKDAAKKGKEKQG